LKLIVPVPIALFADSVRTGPVKVVNVPLAVSAEIALPPVAAVTVTVAANALLAHNEARPITKRQTVDFSFVHSFPQYDFGPGRPERRDGDGPANRACRCGDARTTRNLRALPELLIGVNVSSGTDLIASRVAF